MMKPSRIPTIVGVLLVVVVATGAALGSEGPSAPKPASVLVFPHFDSTDATSTVITVTNTNTDRTLCPGGEARAGDIVLHYIYVQSHGSQFDRFEVMTPGDTLSVISERHNPEIDEGFLVVLAEELDDHRPAVLIDFDALIGSAILIDADAGAVWQYHPVGFRGRLEPEDSCQRLVVDLDGDGSPDFDGFEYDRFPRELVLDSFFEEVGPFRNRLCLMSTAPFFLRAEVEIQLFNNMGDLVLGTFEMHKHHTDSLATLLPLASDLAGDTTEFGKPPVETGWAVIRGLRLVDAAGNYYPDAWGDPAIPPLLGVCAQWLTNRSLSFGGSLYVRGELDGFEAPGGDYDPQVNP